MSVILRKAGTEDLELLVRLRFEYLTAEHELAGFTERDLLEKNLKSYFKKSLKAGDFVAMLAEEDGQVVSCAFLAVSMRPPNPAWPNGRVGIVLNVLTQTKYRQMGIATRVMRELIAEARRMKLTCLELSSTEAGKPLYEGLGFAVSGLPSMQMRL